MDNERASATDVNTPDKEAVQPEGLDTELIELLLDGARYDDLEDVQQALSSHVDVNTPDAAGRTGAQRTQKAYQQACNHASSPTLPVLWGKGIAGTMTQVIAL